LLQVDTTRRLRLSRYGERIAVSIALCPNDRVSNASPDTPGVVQANQTMRDFRDAEAMAHALRVALATRGFNITISQSLELIAQAFGAADWNTLSASIGEQTAGPRNTAATSPQPSTQSAPAFPEAPV
jgi:Glyoxalase superfamily protein